MSDSFDAAGQCLCGKVKITANLSKRLGACHCSTCRQWGSGPFLALTPTQKPHFEGDTFIAKYPSSEWAERGFCTQCGTHLFYHLLGGEQYILPAGLFANTDIEFDHQIFIDEKPEYYDFANDTQCLTGAEVFAQYNQRD